MSKTDNDLNGAGAHEESSYASQNEITGESPEQRFSKAGVCMFALVGAAFASVLMLYVSEPVEGYLLEHTSMVRAEATVLTAVFVLLAAIALSLAVRPWAQRSWAAYGDALPEKIKVVLSKLIVNLALVLLVVAVVFYFALPGSHLWNLARLWWSGPDINLVSMTPEKSFQSTINLPWFRYGQDFGTVSGWSWQGVSQNRSTADAAFAQLHQSGVKCVLWFLLSDGRSAPNFDSRGNVVGIDPRFWQDYDTAIELARKHQVGIIWVLLDFHWLSPAQQENGAALFGHADVIKDSRKRDSFFQRALIPILRRHPLEPQIAGWILINEPENALKEGTVTFGVVADFAQRASALIKKYTYRQPVSIGSVDLESLMEYWGKDSKGLDFLVFHHYEKFLPPPADYVRSLMTGANDKPIYIGEFEIGDPPVPINELVNWSVVLGYAGLWGWKLNEDKAAPHYAEAGQISNVIAATGPDANSFREQFRQWRQSPGISPSGQFNQRMGWWMRHGSETVLPRVSANLEQWGRKLSELKTQMEKLKAERSTKQKELDQPVTECFRLNQADLQDHSGKVDELNLQIADYDNQLRQAMANKDMAWQNNVLKWRREAETSLSKESNSVKLSQAGINGCKKWKSDVESRLQDIEVEMRALLKRPDYVLPEQIQVNDAAAALTSWYSYRIRWSQRLYQDFWNAERQRELERH